MCKHSLTSRRVGSYYKEIANIEGIGVMWCRTILIMLSGLLSGCGAGLQTSSNPFYVVSTFSDSGGVFQGVDSATGNVAVGISPDVVEVVKGANSSPSEGVTGIDPSTFSLMSSNALGNVRQGTMTAGGITASLKILTNPSESVDLVFMSFPGVDHILMTKGSKLVGYPSGTFNYLGQVGTGRRQVGVAPEIGSFSLTANFNAGTYTYEGYTTNTSLTGSGVIDNTSGKIAGNSFTMTTPSRTYSASMYGNFHGNSAADVAGVFHTNDTNPDYAGGFVGSR